MEIILKTETPESGAVWNLFLSAGWNEEYNLTEEEYLNSVLNSRFVVSAYENEKLIGYGRAVCDGIMHAMIYDLIVLPGFQGRGAGGKILAALVELCKESKIRDIQLFSARGKKEFYMKRGFKSRDDEAPGMEYKK